MSSAPGSGDGWRFKVWKSRVGRKEKPEEEPREDEDDDEKGNFSAGSSQSQGASSNQGACSHGVAYGLGSKQQGGSTAAAKSLCEFRQCLTQVHDFREETEEEDSQGFNLMESASTPSASMGHDGVPPETSLPEQGSDTSGKVCVHVNANMLPGSVGAFRDAQVVFEERHFVVTVVDCGCKAWTLRSSQLPGPIDADESRFMLDKTGKRLSITLKKALADDVWHEGQFKLCRQPRMSKAKSARTESVKSACSNSRDSLHRSSNASALSFMQSAHAVGNTRKPQADLVTTSSKQTKKGEHRMQGAAFL